MKTQSDQQSSLPEARSAVGVIRLAGVLVFAACAFDAIAKDITASIVGDEHPVCSDVKYASTDWSFYQNAYGADYKDVARRSYPFALMASNVYEHFDSKKPEFAVPGWEKVESKRTTRKGMGAHIYRSTTGPESVAIVFEGTNKGARDWLFGNLNLFWKGQYKDAEKLITEIAERYPEARLVTTGHSLGGGLAIHAALHHGGVEAFAFNSSPRVFNSRRYDPSESTVTLISENEDILEKFRKRWGGLAGLTIEGPFNKFDFLDLATNDNDRVVEHSVYFIARGLLIVAAAGGDESARRWIGENLDRSKEKECKVDPV